jgi:hypothetical protein
MSNTKEILRTIKESTDRVEEASRNLDDRIKRLELERLYEKIQVRELKPIEDYFKATK